MTAHDEMLDRVAAYALGALPADEIADVTAHLGECEECAAEYRALAPSVSALAASEQACPTGAEGPVVSPLLKGRIMRQVRARARVARLPVPWLAAAAVVVGVVLAGLYGPWHHGRVASVATVTRATYAFPGGEMYVSRGSVYIVARDLRRLPKGRVYQAWTLARGARAVFPSVTFAGGRRTAVRVPQPAAGLVAVAVSVEPAGGSRHPTTKPIALVRLSS